MSKKNFVLIGAAGFIAPRHMKAIQETGNRLIAAIDKNDSVGIIDSFFPETEFFTEFESFESFLDDFQKNEKIDYVSICSPNYLHSAHIRFGLKLGANVICEKPLVLKLEEASRLMDVEKDSKSQVFNILQLRYHESIIQFRKRMINVKTRPHIVLTYITSRGNWYHKSWKADTNKSGGIVANIGIHFFDMLIWIFGKVLSINIYKLDGEKASGYLELERATVSWYLSISGKDLPVEVLSAGKRTFRSILVEKEDLEFSQGFTDLHTFSYESILKGEGFGILDALPSIELVEKINSLPINTSGGQMHPMLKSGKK